MTEIGLRDLQISYIQETDTYAVRLEVTVFAEDPRIPTFEAVLTMRVDTLPATDKEGWKKWAREAFARAGEGSLPAA